MTVAMRNLTYLLRSAAVALAGAVVVSTIWMTSIAYGPMPFWDAWEVATISRSWGRLWSLHNEHMITFPRLFYGLDTAIANGTGKLSIFFIWTFQLTSAILIARMARLQMWIAMPVAISLMFWARHLENLSWSFQVGFIGLCFVAVLTMWLLQRTSIAVAGLALVIGGTAAFWSLNGLLVPLIAAAHCMLNRRFAMAAAFILALLASLGVYVGAGFGSAPTGIAGNVAAPFPKLMHIAVVGFDIVGRPFAELAVRPTVAQRSMIGSFVGAFIVAALLYPLIGLWRSPSPRRGALIGVSLFGLGSCFMAAIGRADAYTGPAFRYAVFAVLGALPILLMWLEKIERRPLVSAFAAVLVSGLFAKNAAAWYPFAVQRGTIEKEAIEAIKAAPGNIESYRLLYPSPEAIREQIAYMRENQLGMF